MSGADLSSRVFILTGTLMEGFAEIQLRSATSEDGYCISNRISNQNWISGVTERQQYLFPNAWPGPTRP